MRKKTTVTFVQSFVLACSLLFSGCSQTATSGTTTALQTTSTTDSTIAETTESKKLNKSYNFMWDENETKNFSNYVKKKLGIDSRSYILYYGFTDELNKVYTEYIDLTYKINDGPYDFSCSNKFYIDMTYVCPDKRVFRNYGSFRTRFLWDERMTNDSFRNKLVISYLINNNIPLGSRIPVDNFESVDKDYINVGQSFNLEFFRKNPDFGNYDKSYKYSSGEMLGALQQYNCGLCYIFYTEGLKDQDLFVDQELVDILNQHLKRFYGENAIQIGKVPTKEQYMAIFGEEPLDLSYIPGAVIK